MTPRWRLFTKYAAFIIILVTVALLASGGVSLYFSYRENQEHLVALQHEKAIAAATRIEQYISDIEHQLGWTTLPQVGAGANPIEQRRYEYLKLLRQAPAITEVAWIDASGHEQLRVSRLAMDVVGSGSDYTKDPKFVEARRGKTWYSPVYFRKETEPYMTISRPAGGVGGGITVAEVNLKFVWEVVSRIQIGKAGLAYVVNSDGTLIAHPDISLVLQKTDLSKLTQVAALAHSDGDDAPIARNLKGEEVLTAHAGIPTLNWTVFVELPLAEAFAPLYASILRIGVLLLAGLVLAVLASVYLARVMVTPIRALQQGAARIGTGQLDQRIEVHTGDELEALAEQFNKMAGDLKSFYAGLERKVAERTAELKESLEQQTAMAEILRVISGSPTDVQPVFDAIAESAARLCEAEDVIIRRVDGDVMRAVAHLGPVPVLRPAIRISRGSIAGRTIIERQSIHVHDALEPKVIEDYPDGGVTLHQGAPYRTMLSVPLLREDAAIGLIFMRRPEIRPFSDKQIKLLETFAAQAVIAIENVRLFKELEARNVEVTESLEQQTATAEILRVISSSPTDIQPVMDAVAASAARLCDASDVLIRRVDGVAMRLVAHVGPMEVSQDLDFDMSTRTFMGRAARERRSIHIHDVLDAHVSEEYPDSQSLVQATGGYRTVLVVPLLREDTVIGVIIIRRPDLRPFSDKQIKLLEIFANQAVIAIENVRLFNETKEALEQQTVISEILRVISSSPTDLQPVFNAIVRSGVGLFGGMDITLRLVKGDYTELVASTRHIHGPSDTNPRPLRDESNPGSRAILRREVVQVSDMVTAEEWVSAEFKQRAERRGVRAIMGAPMLRENKAIGAITVTRATPGLFSDKQIALLRTFADQAVIAIENVRLFREINEALERQTATANILRVISSSPTDIQPVLDAVASTAARLCGASDALIRRVDGDVMRLAAHFGAIPLETEARPINRDSVMGRAVLDKQTIHIHDVAAADEADLPITATLARRHGFRTLLVTPLLREGQPIGAITIRRTEVRPFSDSEIKLLETFADQAVIAIENVRLFNEINEALQRQTATAEILRVISGSPTDVTPVLDTVAHRAAELCEANDARLYVVEGDELRYVAGFGELEGSLKSLPLTRSLVTGRAVVERSVVHIEDLAAVLDDFPDARGPQQTHGARTLLAVPLMRENRAFGALLLLRKEVRPFTEKQIALVKTFADQSAIAIENVRLFNEIQDKSRQLEIANKHKSEFLANMSHELRTPLNAIIGFSEVLVERMFGKLNEKQEEYLRDIHSSGQHLLSLINDILDLSKVEAGRMELEVSEFHFPTALQNAMTLVRERAQTHGIALKLRVDKKLGSIRADERKVKQIALNLLSNAVKFTPDGGRVEVDAHLNDAFVEVSVKDTGVGIAPEDQAVVFEEFRQVGRSYTSKQEGTGLGLALTRRFVELHGGTIRLESAPGKGSTFTFTLPLNSLSPSSGGEG